MQMHECGGICPDGYEDSAAACCGFQEPGFLAALAQWAGIISAFTATRASNYSRAGRYRLDLGWRHAGIEGTNWGSGMRVYIIVVSLALSVIGKANGTVVDTGADAQRYCELLVEGSFHDNVEARSAGACEGMIETAMYFSPNLPADVRACPPGQGSILESARTLLRYLDQNPDRLNLPGITLAFEAFRDAWPCQGDDAEPSGRSGRKKRVPKKSK
jgi:Rap1a immunity proteins